MTERKRPYRRAGVRRKKVSDDMMPEETNQNNEGSGAEPERAAPSAEQSAPASFEDFYRDDSTAGSEGQTTDNNRFQHRGRHRNNRFQKNRGGGGSGGGGGGGGGGRHNRHNNNRRNNRHQQHRRHMPGVMEGGSTDQMNEMMQPPVQITPETEMTGWFDPNRESGFIRRPECSYLAENGDTYVPPHIVRQYMLRRGDKILASVGRDHRGRYVVADILKINDVDPAEARIRPDFASLVASYPDRKLTLETGKPAKSGPELTRRAIDLIAPIGFGQRALIVAPARAGKTMLLQAIIEGVATNHPDAALMILLVDERPEEVSEMVMLGQGEVIASSFDMPAVRHVDVAEMVLERARRLVEMGKDVVIVLDSITRMARAYNTVERGTGRTLSGGLDSSAMARPKAFFGSARSVAPEHGGGSLTIIATALVETGSRMDDVIFEEFKGTGNCEIKLDRSLAEKRIYPAIDIPTSGTRREDKLFAEGQLEHVYTLRRGLQQLPASSAMEWLIKRIAATPNNDALLEGL